MVHELKPEVIFHLASEVTGARRADLVVPLMHANQGIAVILLAAVAQKAPEARVIMAGSLEEKAIDADAAPTSPYAAAKLGATLYAKMFAQL
jgi:nucleoside-diphosphate-sugar epimerase